MSGHTEYNCVILKVNFKLNILLADLDMLVFHIQQLLHLF